MDNKTKIIIFGVVILAIVIIIIMANKMQDPEKKIAKEIAASMVSEEKFIETFEKNFNYKAVAALNKAQESDEFAQAIKDMDSKAVGDVVESYYSKVTDQDIDEIKSMVEEIEDRIEVPYVKLEVDEISDPYDDAFCPCFKDRAVILKDSSGNNYYYVFVFYDNKLVDITKKI